MVGTPARAVPWPRAAMSRSSAGIASMAAASASGASPQRASARARAASVRSMAASRARSENTARIASVANSGPTSSESRAEKLMGMAPELDRPRHHHFLDLRDGLGGIEALRAGVGAVHDRVAAVEPERIVQGVEPLPRRLVARVDQPAIGLQEGGRAEKAIPIPPVARAGGRAAGAQDALVETVEALALLRTLLPLRLRRRSLRLQPGLDRGVLGEEARQVRHQVLDHRHMRQGIDLDGLGLAVVDAHRTGERVLAHDVHGTGAADALAAGAPEHQRRVDRVLDPDQGVEDHRPAVVAVDVVGIDARVLPVFRIPAVDAEFADMRGMRGARPGLAFGELGVFWQCEFDHGGVLVDSGFGLDI